MFVKETKVKRGERAYTYVQLVEGYRDERGKVRHRVVANLGRKEELKASGQLEKLAGAFARLDPPLVGTRREVGALLLAWLRDFSVRRNASAPLAGGSRDKSDRLLDNGLRCFL